MLNVMKCMFQSIKFLFQKYEKYTPLWLEDRQEVLQGFLKYGRVIPPEEFDKYRYENGCDPPEVKPKLEQYQKEV